MKRKDIIIYPIDKYFTNGINQCDERSCRTCNLFVSDQTFRSNLAGKEYKTITYDRLSCSSTAVIYGIHSVHCGLVYVTETGRSLRSRINGHKSATKKGGQSLLYRHLHQPDYSVEDMRVQILENIYHSTENLTLITSVRRIRELFLIKELGTRRKRSHAKGSRIKELLSQMSLVDLLEMTDKPEGVHNINTSTSHCFPFHFHSFAL